MRFKVGDEVVLHRKTNELFLNCRAMLTNVASRNSLSDFLGTIYVDGKSYKGYVISSVQCRPLTKLEKALK